MPGLLTFLKDSIFSLKINSVSLKRGQQMLQCLNSPSFVTQPSMKRNQQQLHYSTSVKHLTPLSIEHNILVKKLECYGIRGKSNEWFCSYLANRRQYVEINDNKSITSTITCGVPPGIYTGPPFVHYIYINEMHKPLSYNIFTMPTIRLCSVKVII